jgi:hypothetical protein
VRRVRDELALLAQRDLEGAEHLVEARREAAQLVVAGRRDAPGQIARARDLLDDRRQALDRGDRGARHDRAERRREEHAAEGHEDEARARLGEYRVDVGHGERELERGTAAQRHREHAVVRATDGRVEWRAWLLGRGDLLRL